MVKIRTIASAAGAVMAGTVAAQAGGIERSVFNPGFLFEKGNYAEFSLGRVAPEVSGVQAVPAPAPGFGSLGGSSGDVAPDYTTISGAVKFQINDQWALGIIVDQPIGADVLYGNAAYIYGAGLGGSRAEIDALGVTVLAHYRLNERMSVYGGIKAESVEGQVALFSGYTMSTDRVVDYGFVVGAAYEIPDIALRVALTYTSDIDHTFQSQESFGGPVASTSFTTTVPQSLALDFQSGIAEDTLLFGSIRWRDWSEFEIAPPNFAASSGALVSYSSDSVTYTLGVGRRFSDTWSGAVFVSHEPSAGGFSGNLGPTDGYTSVGLGATYTQDKMKITGGLTYARIGDAITEAPSAFAPPGTTLGRFTDNSLIGFGVKVGWSF